MNKWRVTVHTNLYGEGQPTIFDEVHVESEDDLETNDIAKRGLAKMEYYPRSSRVEVIKIK